MLNSSFIEFDIELHPQNPTDESKLYTKDILKMRGNDLFGIWRANILLRGIWNGNNWIRYNNYLKYIWTWTGIVQREGPQMGKWDQLKWGTLVNMDKLARGPVFVLYRYIHLIYHVDFSFLQGPCLIEITIWVKSPNENNFWPMLCLEQHMQETC